MSFEWDQNKATRNLKKHSIDFADAVTVFDDFNSVTVNDPGHDEDRFVTIGMDAYGGILVVVYSWRVLPPALSEPTHHRFRDPLRRFFFVAALQLFFFQKPQPLF